MNNFLIKINKIKKSVHDFFKVSPHKHWTVLMVLFLSLIFILILLSLYFLYEIKNEKIFQIKTDQKPKQTLLKEKLLKNTTEFYDDRAKNTEDINSKGIPYKDPGI